MPENFCARRTDVQDPLPGRLHSNIILMAHSMPAKSRFSVLNAQPDLSGMMTGESMRGGINLPRIGSCAAAVKMAAELHLRQSMN